MSDAHTLEIHEYSGLSLKASVLAFIASTTAMTLLMVIVGNL